MLEEEVTYYYVLQLYRSEDNESRFFLYFVLSIIPWGVSSRLIRPFLAQSPVALCVEDKAGVYAG